MCFTDPGQGVAAAEYVKNTGIAAKVGVIYNNGSGVVDGQKDQLSPGVLAGVDLYVVIGGIVRGIGLGGPSTTPPLPLL